MNDKTERKTRKTKKKRAAMGEMCCAAMDWDVGGSAVHEGPRIKSGDIIGGGFG